METENNTNAKIMGGLVLVGAIVGAYFLLSGDSDKPKKSLNGSKSLKDEYDHLTDINDHSGAAKVLVGQYGTKAEKKTINRIAAIHDKKGKITEFQRKMRDSITRKYYKHLRNS